MRIENIQLRIFLFNFLFINWLDKSDAYVMPKEVMFPWGR